MEVGIPVIFTHFMTPQALQLRMVTACNTSRQACNMYATMQMSACAATHSMQHSGLTIC